MNDFYQKLGKTITDNNIQSEDIWNMDETPVGTVPKGNNRVLACEGRRQVGGFVSAKKGERVTAAICFSATGQYMTHILIFPRNNITRGAW